MSTPRRSGHSEPVRLVENNDSCLLPIVAVDGRIVGLITDPDVCAGTVGQRRLDSTSDARRIFRCKSNDEVRAALKTILNSSKVEVEVAGGILRHHRSW